MTVRCPNVRWCRWLDRFAQNIRRCLGQVKDDDEAKFCHGCFVTLIFVPTLAPRVSNSWPRPGWTSAASC